MGNTRFFSSQSLYQSNGIAMIRMLTGFFLLYHGWEIFNSATMRTYQEWDQFKGTTGKTLVYLGKGAELLSGSLLFIGWLTRIGALLATGTLLYIAFFVGTGKIWYEDQHPFLFVLLGLVFFFTGPGSLSVDAWIDQKNRPTIGQR